MQLVTNLRAFGRAVVVIIVVIAAVSGVTFAALQSQQAKLTGNTIETATANLQLSTDGSTFGASQTGFDFNNLVPGGQPVPQFGQNIYLKNSGGTPLQLKLAITTTPSNPSNVDLSKVNLLLTLRDNPTPQIFSLQSLITASASGGAIITAPATLAAGSTAQYSLQIAMAGDAFSGSSASLGNIDLAFSGLAQSN